MKRPFIILILAILFCLTASATTYVSQGGGSLTCNGGTQSTVSVATFNSSTPAAGDVIWLCGTITSAVHERGDGSSGNPITMNFDAGAKISLPVCNDVSVGTTCLNIGSWIVVNGGTACGPGTTCSANDTGTGIIEATTNGTGLATQQCNSQAILARGGNNEVKNLIIRNVYKHTSSTDNTCGGGDDQAYYNSSSNGTSMHDMTIHDVGTGWREAGVSSNISFYNIHAYNYNWAFQSGVGGGLTASNYFIHDNHFGSTANWDDTLTNHFHHNSIFLFDNCGSDTCPEHFSNVYIYNNLFDGGRGCCSTSQVYFGGGDPNPVYLWNNVFDNRGQSAGLANGLLVATGGHLAGTRVGTVTYLYNNSFLGAGTGVDVQPCAVLEGTVRAMENNVFDGCATLVNSKASPSTITAAGLNSNFYGAAGTNVWQYQGSNQTTLGAWQSATSGDENAVKASNAMLNPDGSPQAGSPVIGAGTNLTALCSGSLLSLCSDTSDGGARTPVTRPPTGAWDDGAYADPSGTPPAPPTGLNAAVQ